MIPGPRPIRRVTRLDQIADTHLGGGAKRRDPFLPELEEKLSNLTRAGYDATRLVRPAAAAGPLPDDHPAAALWWRILDQLPQTPNQDPATPAAVPATRRTTATSHDKQPPLPRSAPPPAFGPSR